MMAALGGVQFDGKETVTTDLYDLDSTQEQLLNWVKTSWNADMIGKGWRTATSGTVLEDKDPIAFTLNRLPDSALLKQLKIDFPLLCLWRRESRGEQLTLDKEQE